MSATRLQTLQYNAIEAVNAIVECKGTTDVDRHRAIVLVQLHLEARAEQVVGSGTIPEADPDADLL